MGNDMTNIVAEKLLTKKQIAILDQLNTLDRQGLTLVALKGKGSAAKLSAEVVGELALDDAMVSFVKSKCTNIRPFSVLINSLTNQFVGSDKLTACPTKKAEFFEYYGQVLLWANESKTEKTRVMRLKTLETIGTIITQVRQVSERYHEDQALQAAQAEALQAAQAEALQAAQAVTA
jgi:hypothetical protein